MITSFGDPNEGESNRESLALIVIDDTIALFAYPDQLALTRY